MVHKHMVGGSVGHSFGVMIMVIPAMLLILSISSSLALLSINPLTTSNMRSLALSSSSSTRISVLQEPIIYDIAITPLDLPHQKPKRQRRTSMRKGLCIKTPDPIPLSGQQDAIQLLQSGRLYRYGAPTAEDSIVSQCEKDIATYTGHKYCIALNSCGSALMLLLKTTGVQNGDIVLSNAFTFGAVPSAIEHAGGIAVYVESTMDMIIDVQDLEKKLILHPSCRHVLISHMRGKVADMKTIQKLCNQYDAVLLEDCAHSLGVMYNHEHSGHMGIACAISSQSYKMINSGEGGFLLTNDPDIAAQTAVLAGAYEGLSSKHLMVPSKKHFKDYPTKLPNYSLRMSELTAAIIRPQIRTIDDRIDVYERRYNKLVHILEERLSTQHITIPQLTPEVSRMVHDSLQFNLGTMFTSEMIQEFINECKDHGLFVELFGHVSNARNFVNWGFAPTSDPLPNTSHMLQRACDVRLPLMWDDHDFNDMANVIIESIDHVLREHGYKSD